MLFELALCLKMAATMDGSKKVLLVDDEQDLLSSLRYRMNASGYKTVSASTAKDALDKVSRGDIDLIILDVNLPDMSGFQVKEHLNANHLTAHIPVIFLTALNSLEEKIRGLNVGAEDYVVKPFEAEELLARSKGALRRKDYYESMTQRDALTGLGNKPYFDKQFALFFDLTRRYGNIFSLVLIDFNDFKLINDHHGHLAGDFALKEFAVICGKVLRTSDIVARCGGDEFAVIMPNTDASQAEQAIERLKAAIASESHMFGEKSISFSISAGVATCKPKQFDSPQQVFELADKMLYQQKEAK